jgi:hypothetical protein
MSDSRLMPLRLIADYVSLRQQVQTPPVLAVFHALASQLRDIKNVFSTLFNSSEKIISHMKSLMRSLHKRSWEISFFYF